jgi:hypothetical protein
MNLSLVLRFTDPAAPLYIGIDGENDSGETLFVISTSQVHGAPARPANPVNDTAGGAKREREERTVTPAPSKKLIRAVQPVETPLHASNNRKETVPPASARSQVHYGTSDNLYPEAPENQPLFLQSPPKATVDKRPNHVHEQEPCSDSPRSIFGETADAFPEVQRDWQDEDEMELDATQNTVERLNVMTAFILSIAT